MFCHSKAYKVANSILSSFVWKCWLFVYSFDARSSSSRIEKLIYLYLILDKAFDLVVAVCIPILTLIWPFELNQRLSSITIIPLFFEFLESHVCNIKDQKPRWAS